MIKDNLQSQILSDSRWTGLYEKIKELYDSYASKVDLIRWIYRADMTPFPVELAASRGVFYESASTAREIRQLIYESPTFQRRILQFQAWKPFIDLITGGDSSIFKGLHNISFVVGTSTVGSLTYRIGTNPVTPGFVMIDLGLIPSESVLDTLQNKLSPLSSIYFIIEVGYVVTPALPDDPYFVTLRRITQ